MNGAQIEPKNYEMPPLEGFTVTYFLTVADIERSARFYETVFGGRILSLGDSKGASGHIQIANTWLIVNVGGGPTPDKPSVTLSVTDPDRISSFMNIRVADIQACYELWKSRGAEFITEPMEKIGETCCYLRDPDGYIIRSDRASRGSRTGKAPRVLRRAELPIDTAQLARFLIGKILVRKLTEGVAGGRIVETEAYSIGDAAGHAYRGITPRNGTLFLTRGHAYVYIAYGTSFMLNVSSEAAGVGAGVLIRAIEPTDGISIMERNRGTEQIRDLARGPGRLCQALRIDRSLDGIDLCRKGPLWLASDGGAAGEIGRGKRIGITRAADSPLRFYVRENRFVSGTRALNK